MATCGHGASGEALAEPRIVGMRPAAGDDRAGGALSLRLFGHPTLFAGERPLALSPGATMLCAYLALAPRGERARSTAAAQLFADCPEPMARRRLNTALWRLKTEIRSTAGTDWIVNRGARSIGLGHDATAEMVVDVSVFEELVRPVLQESPASLTPLAADRLASAVDLHRGPLLESCDDEWVLADRYRIENLYLTALDYLIQHHGARGDVGAVAKYGQLALELEPLREDLHRDLMRAYASAGRIDLAEGQFERCRLLLRQELGVDPMPETTALRLQLTRRIGSPEVDYAALVAELESARADVARLAVTVDRALDQLRGSR
jgi:DNA-binding SARP family transcriptional activator